MQMLSSHKFTHILVPIVRDLCRQCTWAAHHTHINLSATLSLSPNSLSDPAYTIELIPTLLAQIIFIELHLLRAFVLNLRRRRRICIVEFEYTHTEQTVRLCNWVSAQMVRAANLTSCCSRRCWRSWRCWRCWRASVCLCNTHCSTNDTTHKRMGGSKWEVFGKSYEQTLENIHLYGQHN